MREGATRRMSGRLGEEPIERRRGGMGSGEGATMRRRGGMDLGKEATERIRGSMDFIEPYAEKAMGQSREKVMGLKKPEERKD